jgi:sterol desaturase/sphingolipid hydroxylase (fatty acid hydroxylase superfamily)
VAAPLDEGPRDLIWINEAAPDRCHEGSSFEALARLRVLMARAVGTARARMPSPTAPPPFVTRALEALLEPLRAFTRPDARVYWAYLLGAGVLATAVWLARPAPRGPLSRFLFPRSIWLHRSALFDYRLLFARALVKALLLAPLSFSTVYVATRVWMRLRTWLGPSPIAALEREAALLVFAVAAFVAQDLARYVVHRLAHAVPALWELHKVHHSAEVMTPFTVYRAHPLESLLMRSGAALAVALVAGVCLWAFPGKLSGATILGVDLLSFGWTLLGANLRHSHVWLSYGRWIEHVLISPAQHQLHHSSDPAHFHKNLGSTFALWDWLGGTLLVPSGKLRLCFGLPPHERNHDDTVISALLRPVWLALGGGWLAARWAARSRPRG